MVATETETKEQIKIREREGGRRGGNTGEEVLMYSGRGVVPMRGREGQRERKKKEIRKEQAKEFVRN